MIMVLLIVAWIILGFWSPAIAVLSWLVFWTGIGFFYTTDFID